MARHPFIATLCSLAISLAPLSSGRCFGQTSPGRPVELRQAGSKTATTPEGTGAVRALGSSADAHDVKAPALRQVCKRVTGYQTTQLTNLGIKLAMKGATFSARSKFLEALEVITDSLDAENHTQFHSRALRSGLIALREADDFGHIPGTIDVDADPVTTAAGHSTPILKFAKPHTVTRLQALQLYYSYATQQLAAAVGGVSDGSTALCCLGRLQPFLGERLDGKAKLAEPKAIVLLQAAILVNPKNHFAVNELGVVFARCGQLEAARKALLYGVSIQPEPEVFKNLAAVCKRLGDTTTSEAMIQRASMISAEKHTAGTDQSADSSPIYWVDHKTFNGQKPADQNSPFLMDGGAAASGSASALVHQTSAMQAMQSSPGTAQDFLQPPPWEVFAQGEYIGPARLAHVPEYYLRVDDQVVLIFRVNGKPTTKPYRLGVGDVIHITSITVPNLTIDTQIEPDGTIILPQIGPVYAAGKSIEGLRAELDQRFHQYFKEPAITVTPVTINTVLQELRNAIVNRQGIYAGQAIRLTITPDGTLQMPGLGSVAAQGLTLAELQNEIESRYAEIVSGMEVTATLSQRAPRSIVVLGEVRNPGIFPIEKPTDIIQAIAMAGSWNIGGNLREVIVLRRDDNWRLMACRVDIKPALYNHRSLRAEDIWLRDSDIVIVSKQPIQVANDIISMVFTRGIYAVFPFGGWTFFSQVPALP